MSEEDERFRRLFLSFDKLFCGDETFAERVRKQIQLYREKAIDEPSSLRQELKALHARGLSEDFAQNVGELSGDLSEWTSHEFDFFPPAHDFFRFVKKCVEGIGRVPAHAQISTTLEFDMPVLRARLIESMRQPLTIAFERRVRVLSDVLRDSAEAWYKPLLRFALTFSRASDGRSVARVPSELGMLLTSCRTSTGIPSSILFEPIRIIRNSVAHSQTEIDLDRAAVTYVNLNRKGEREAIGPLSWDEVLRLSDAYLFLCWSMTIVLRRHRRLTGRDVS